MYNKKIIHEIHWIEKEYAILKKALKKHHILKTKKHLYLTSDKDSFCELWRGYLLLFKKIKRNIKLTSYRKFFFKINYNKMVLNRFLLIFYYNIIQDLIVEFGEHEEFIRQLLNDRFQKDLKSITKYIYQPKHLNLLNTPYIFLEVYAGNINQELRQYYAPEKVFVKNKTRIYVDYRNFYFHLKYRFDNILLIFMRVVGMMLSRIRFTKRIQGLITDKNIKLYLDIAQPGDILLTRGNWNATNASIPGFWKHMSLYVGTGEFLKKYYDGQIKMKLNNKIHYIIESTGEGVLLKPIKDLVAHNDYLCASRTTFREKKIVRVIGNAINAIGNDYDFLFNFHSEKSMVCSELVLKSYAKETKHDEGIDIDLQMIGGGLTFPPHNFIKILQDQRLKKNRVVSPVFFIDSIEKKQKNFIAHLQDVYDTATRSRFSFFQK